MKECRKEKLTYKMAALQCAGPILETHQVDRYKDVQDILDPLIAKVSEVGFWTKWLTYCRHFQMHFLDRKLLHLIKISLKFVAEDSVDNKLMLFQ